MRDNGGFSVLELLVASGAGLVGLAAVSALVRADGRLLAATSAEVVVREAGRRVVESIVRETREAGFDRRPPEERRGAFVPDRDGLAVAREDELAVCADRNPPDGVADRSSDECIGFLVRSGELLETIGRQRVPLVPRGALSAGGFRLRYFDSCGTELAPPPDASLGAAERSRVRKIAVALRLTSPVRGRAFELDAAAVLRNRPTAGCRE
ncbi:MAG: hypothetical protein QOD06_3070 [Candidatus Binatota bacterium]|jgi:hypothetical protein|nr:hypothetical protein [Candidatus Binatota bacterium]